VKRPRDTNLRRNAHTKIPGVDFSQPRAALLALAPRYWHSEIHGVRRSVPDSLPRVAKLTASSVATGQRKRRMLLNRTSRQQLHGNQDV